jgi:mono/diheme cytochrome c family protein
MKSATFSCSLFVGLFLLSAPVRSSETAVDYNRDIRPILAKNCFACHGQDDGHRAAKLRLDRRETALLPRKRGAAIVPQAPEKSLLLQRVADEDEQERMPPKENGQPLTAAQIALLKRWIAQGAPYAEHWAFVKPKRPPLPSVKDPTWPRNGVDFFVLSQLEKHGLKPMPEADRSTLLRRVSLDLRGLPPTPGEVDEFLKDPSPNAYEKMVERFLDDTAYGERWARMWLDLARYADSAGYGSDPLRPHIWRYRDWVIDAFNRNLPYDQFTIEQLAGDLLPNPTVEQRVATAFHRNTMTNTEGGTDDEEFRVAAVKDRVDTTVQVWMGMTMGCAKCHSHKYDPITQQEYYRFYAFFNQTADNDRPDESPTLAAPSAEQEENLRRIDSRLAELKRQWAEPSLVAVRSLRRKPIPLESLTILGEMGQLAKARPVAPSVPVMVELPAKQRRKTHLMMKGNFLNPGELVEPGVPSAFPALPKDAPRNRLAVAKWLLHPDNPLTARVAVNRFWAALFGVGLVETEEDFGTQGEMPSHPELLDWLAVEYVRLGWDTKALLKLLVTSATYRQSSKVAPETLAKDPRNRLLSRGPRFRLEAEMVRDQALALSGLLSRKLHGPSVYPPQPPGLWQAAFNGQRTWTTSNGEDRYRRGLYTFWRRTVPYPSMAAFDATSRETCTVRRIRTNTPLQAFITLNDPVYVECAQALARRIVKEGGTAPEERARFGLRLCLCRPPSHEQVRQVLELFQKEREHYRNDNKAALALATDPLGPLPASMDAAELAAWTVVANVLLNLDAVLSKG